MKNNNSGSALLLAVLLSAMAAVLVAGVYLESSSHLLLAGRGNDLEKSFYAAEAGAERAVAYIITNGTIPGTISGTLGNNARYSTSILGIESIGDTNGAHTASGSININPNNSPDNEFMIMFTDGTVLTRDDLHQDQSDRSGTAVLIHVRPKGPGSQNSLIIDGSPFAMSNNTTYTLTSDSIAVQLWNDNRNPQGKAVGQWYLQNISGNNVTLDDGASGGGGGSGGSGTYSILSLGAANDSKRFVILDGVHQESWAKYALWYDHYSGAIWIVGGETFNGPVHANVPLYISGNPIFNALLTSAAAAWGAGSDISGAVFAEGYTLGVPVQTMTSISFSNLLGEATLTVTGPTRVVLSSTNAVITNPQRGWTNYAYTIPSNGLIYARSSGGATGTVTLSGTNGLDGRLTIATDYDIIVTNHVRYAVHPTNGSDDALGLLVKHDVIIATNAPTNLDVYAHIVCTGEATGGTATNDGSFYVQNYSTRPASGPLNVYGGIVQNYRGPVGTTTPTGFLKNYTYDTRFATNPPPHYPALTNEYIWTGWRERPAQ